MKKILLPLFLLSVTLMLAQTNRLIIEVDHSQKYLYESTYSSLKADFYKREAADKVKNHADKYFTELQRMSDQLTNYGIQPDEMTAEFNRLKNYGNNILNLLVLMQSDNTTGENLKYTIEKAWDELNYSIENGELKKLTSKAGAIAGFQKYSDTEILNTIKKFSGQDSEDLKKEYVSQTKFFTFRTFIIDRVYQLFIKR